jgi:hypothetical protein
VIKYELECAEVDNALCHVIRVIPINEFLVREVPLSVEQIARQFTGKTAQLANT